MTLYENPKLTELVKKWVNLDRIKYKDYVQETPLFQTKLKKFTESLSKIEEPNFHFNKESIKTILEGVLKK